jgi:hypothetical protein
MGLLSTIGAASGRAFGFTRSVITTATDAFFNRVTLLLPGNGTNGAQNNTFLDSSTNNFTITRNGNTTQGTFSPFSQTGWSNFFGGAGSYLSNTSAALIGASTSTFTAEAWIYMTAAPTSDVNAIGSVITLDGQAANATNYMGFGVISNQKVTLRWFDGAGKTCTGSSTLALNTWHHIALVANSNALAIYVNGVAETLTGTTTLTNRGGTSNEFAIGANLYTSFTGYISNVRVSNTALYTSAFTPSTIPLTSPSGTLLLTCQSNRFIDTNTQVAAKTITPGGSPSVQAFSPFLPTAAYSAATVGGSGYFDGTGDSLSVANNSALSITGNVDASIEFWVYPISGSGVVVNKSGVSGSVFPNYSVGVNSNGSISFFLGNSGSPGSSVTTLTTSAGTIPFNAWSHVVCTKTYVGGGSVNNYRVMINGILSNNSTQNNPSDGNPGALTIGFEPSSTDDINAYISQLRIFNTSIPAAYQTSSTTNGTSIYTVPTTPITAGTSSICTLFTNAGITDATAKNVLETVGNAQISTTQSKFGGSSILFDGTGDILYAPYSPNFNFGTGDFTVEFWMWKNNTNNGFIITCGTNTSIGNWNISLSSSSLFWQSRYGVTNLYSRSATSILDGNWHHVAITRASGVQRMFFDGVLQGATVADTTDYVMTTTAQFGIGLNGFDGYIDDLRITRGYARYTANFTPPTTAFPLQ